MNSIVPARRCVCLFTLSIALAPGANLVAAEPGTPANAPSAAAAEPAALKTHSLFMGTDIAIEKNKAYHRVRDVSGSSFVITLNGKPEFIPVRLSSLNLKVEQSLKLSGVTATVSNLSGERAYTPGNDPRMQQQKAAIGVTATVGDNASLSMGKYIYAQNKFGLAFDSDSSNQYIKAAAEGLEKASREAADAAFKDYQMASAMQNSDLTSGGFYRERAEADMKEEMFDAMEVMFEISSPTPLNNPYAVIITRFHERNAKPGTVRDWIYASSLDPIDETPRKIRLLQGGFPRGFVLDNFRVHIYNRGDEVATNVSPRRVALTRDEAFEYVKIDYVSKNRSATLPPTAAMGVLPPDFHKRLSGGVLDRTFYVKVLKTGETVQLFEDDACTQPVQDEYLCNVVRNIRFKPALEKGKPVDGIASLKLGQLKL